MTRLNDGQLAKLSNKIIKIGNTEMTAGEATRWILLMEALDYIGQECDEQGIEFDIDIITKKAKPHKAIVRYIEERYVACLHDMFI